MYLHLNKQQRRNVASMAAVRYEITNKKMQENFDKEPENWSGREGQPGRHAEFEGDYARDNVRHILNREYGHRKAFKEGYGIPLKVELEIIDLAIAIRKDYVSRGFHTPTAAVKQPTPSVATNTLNFRLIDSND